MNIIGAEIEWYDGYANAPGLRVTTDGKVPRREDLRYEELFLTARSSNISREQQACVGEPQERDLHVLYAEHPSGYVSFVSVGTETSYCGASGGDFTLTDGRELHVRSGWTIASMAIRQHADVIECSFLDDPRYRTAMAGFLLADKAREVIEEFCPGVEMYDAGGWTFKWAEGPTKREWQETERALYEASGETYKDRTYECRPYSRWPEYVGAEA